MMNDVPDIETGAPSHGHPHMTGDLRDQFLTFVEQRLIGLARESELLAAYVQQFRCGRGGEILKDERGRPSFDSLSNNYSMDAHNCPDISPSPNQCAVRLSRALIAAGVPMDPYPGNLCRHGYARGAQDLAAFLRNKWGQYEYGFSNPGDVPGQIRGKKGVIVFMNIPGFSGQGHIDLWDGATTKSGAYWNADPIWMWTLG